MSTDPIAEVVARVRWWVRDAEYRSVPLDGPRADAATLAREVERLTGQADRHRVLIASLLARADTAEAEVARFTEERDRWEVAAGDQQKRHQLCVAEVARLRALVEHARRVVTHNGTATIYSDAEAEWLKEADAGAEFDADTREASMSRHPTALDLVAYPPDEPVLVRREWLQAGVLPVSDDDERHDLMGPDLYDPQARAEWEDDGGW